MSVLREKLYSVCLALLLAGPVTAQSDLDFDRELDAGVTEGCAAEVSPPAARQQALSGAVKILPPAEGYYVGTYQIPTNPGEAEQFAHAVGQFPPILFSFHDLFSEENGSARPDQQLSARMEGEDSLPLFEMASYLDERGSVLALAWAIYCCDIEKTAFWLRKKKPYETFNRILAGEMDDVFRRGAQQIKAYGRPVMLTLVPEFNWQGVFLFGADGRQWMDAVGNICNQYGDPAWPDGPERIRDVYRHVIDLFRREGVGNVTWFMYSGNNYMAEGVEGQSRWLHPKYFYPGDAYIDWVGQSIFFTDAKWAANYDETRTFDQVFLPGYKAWQSVTRRPMLLAEFGVVSEPDQDRSHLWQDALIDSLPDLPGVKAITIADTTLFADYFNIPRLRDKPDELEIVRRVVGQGKTLRSGTR